METEATNLTIASFKGEGIPNSLKINVPNSFVVIGTFPRLVEGQNLKLEDSGIVIEEGVGALKRKVTLKFCLIGRSHG